MVKLRRKNGKIIGTLTKSLWGQCSKEISWLQMGNSILERGGYHKTNLRVADHSYQCVIQKINLFLPQSKKANN